ncbi:hypothetical protein ACH4S8_42975 [Streptomyces sp. NPDC021080]|uniref:hypothetical protein n=1 Tax=Streptomyces sp. NPDC021080 TaxID=3365110 RepID=UPI00379FAE00
MAVLLYATNTIPNCRITGSWGLAHLTRSGDLSDVLDRFKAQVASWGAEAVVGTRIEPTVFVGGNMAGPRSEMVYLVYGTPVTYEGK